MRMTPETARICGSEKKDGSMTGIDTAWPMATGRPVRGHCPHCGASALSRCTTATTIWCGGRAHLIEGIPAFRCRACREILIDGETAKRLRDIHRGLKGLPQALRACAGDRTGT